MSETKTREASCCCGKLKVVVAGDPQTIFACHCDYCQRATGSVAVFGAVYREEDIVSAEGDTTVFDDIPKWSGAERYFCSSCGNTVHWINPAAFPGMHMVAVGCFADPEFPAPAVTVQTQYRQAWCQGFTGSEEHEAFPG